jgi:hypothetical protein
MRLQQRGNFMDRAKNVKARFSTVCAFLGKKKIYFKFYLGTPSTKQQDLEKNFNSQPAHPQRTWIQFYFFVYVLWPSGHQTRILYERIPKKRNRVFRRKGRLRRGLAALPRKCCGNQLHFRGVQQILTEGALSVWKSRLRFLIQKSRLVVWYPDHAGGLG